MILSSRWKDPEAHPSPKSSWVLGGGGGGRVRNLYVATSRGVAKILGRGPSRFFQIGKFAAKPCTLLRGFRPIQFQGMPPREIIFKMVNLVRFGIYLDQILSLKFF